MDSNIKLMLRAGMSGAFQSYTVLRLFVSDKLGRQLNWRTPEIVGLDANFDELLMWAEEGGWLAALLDQFEQHGNPGLKGSATIAKAQLAATAGIMSVIPPNPLDSLLLGKKKLFIGRENLRSILREMEGPGPIAPVLMVTGLNRCGKSYSFQLLRLLDLLRPANIVAKIDFKTFRGGAVAERYRDIISQINLRMELPETGLPPRNESEVRWFEHVIRKFDQTARKNGQRLWLVFDHIQAGAANDSKIVDAITQVITYAADEGGNLRVVVIGQDPYELMLEDYVRDQIQTDYAALPDKSDILKFLEQLRDEARVRLQAKAKQPPSDSELANAAEQIMTTLKAIDSKTLPSRYSEVTWTHAERLDLI